MGDPVVVVISLIDAVLVDVVLMSEGAAKQLLLLLFQFCGR